MRLDGRFDMPELRDPWDSVTSQGAEYEQLRRGAARTFRERLEWVAFAAQLARKGREQAEARRKAAESPESG